MERKKTFDLTGPQITTPRVSIRFPRFLTDRAIPFPKFGDAMSQIGSGHYSGFAHMAYRFKVTHNQQSENICSYSENKCRSCAMSRNVSTRVGTLIVATIYLQPIQNRHMFRSFTVLQCSHQHCVQPVASDVEVVGYL